MSLVEQGPDADTLQALAQRLQAHFPGSHFTPVPDMPVDGGVPDGQQLPVDYKTWMWQVGHGPIGDSGLRIYPKPCLGREVIPEHKRHGLSDVVVVAGDDQHHFVLYNTRFIPWYIHVVVGELGLMSALQPDMTFTDYLAYLCRGRQPHAGEQDYAAWWQASPYFLTALIVSAIVVFALILWAAWVVQGMAA